MLGPRGASDPSHLLVTGLHREPEAWRHRNPVPSSSQKTAGAAQAGEWPAVLPNDNMVATTVWWLGRPVVL